MDIEEMDNMGFEHDNGWVIGSLINDKCPFIVGPVAEADQEYLAHEWWVPVDPETVGQYTGLTDKNGKEIYEGDVLKGNSFATSMLKGWGADVEQQFEVYEIRYDEASFKTFNKKGEWVAILNHHVSSKVKDLEVIGNIYENKDLLNA